MSTESKEPGKTLTRRSFLTAMGVSGVALAVAACAAPAAPGAPAAQEPAAPEAPTAEAPVAEAPAEQAPGAEPATIVVSSWFNMGFNLNMPAFNEAHPEIKVEVIDEEFAAHHDKLLTALVAGTGAADVTGIEDARLHLMANTGGLADLTDYMAPYKDKLVPYKANFATFQGKNIAVPWDSSPVLLYFRRDIMEEHGVDPAKILTYDDLTATLQKLYDESDGRIKMQNVAQDGVYPLMNWLWQQGSGIVSPDGSKVIVDGPEGVRSLEYLKSLWDADLVFKNMTGDAGTVAIKAGEMPLFPHAIWNASFIAGAAPETIGKWGVVPLPVFEAGGSTATIWGGSAVGIPAQSKHIPEAFTFAEFNMLMKEGSEAQWLGANLFPVLTEAADWPIMNDPVEFYGGQPALKMYAEANALVPKVAYGKDWLETSRMLGQQQSEALEGNKTPEQALADAAAEMRTTFNFS